MTRPREDLIPVLIASTLKPVHDSRAFEKLALSLGETNKYRLNIIGFSPKKPKSEGNIRFFSSMSHFDSLLDRLLAQVRFAWTLWEIKPKLVISCTYEYLPFAFFFRQILGYKLVYDVQENYLANLDISPDLTSGKRSLARKLIQWADGISPVDLYLLAEKCYATEMPEKRPFVVLENKFNGEIRKIESKSFRLNSTFRFCITGTITPAYGIREGIEWFRNIELRYPGSQLSIIGHVPSRNFYQELQLLALEIPGITLKTSLSPLPHQELIDALLQSDFALLPYPVIPAFANKIPTKLFECAALGIPVLISPNPNWQNFYQPFTGGASIDFSDPKSAFIQFHQILDQRYFSTPPPNTVLWTSEKLQFQEAIEKLLS